MKEKLKITLGLLLIPIFAALYYNDKLLLFLLPHIEQKAIHKWFTDNKQMTNSGIRVVAFWASIGIYNVITYVLGLFA